MNFWFYEKNCQPAPLAAPDDFEEKGASLHYFFDKDSLHVILKEIRCDGDFG